MAFARSAASRFWTRVVRSYRLACARDDAAREQVTIPSGLWVCEHCFAPLLEFTTFREHLRTAHSAP